MGREALALFCIDGEEVDRVEHEYRERDRQRLDSQTASGDIHALKENMFSPENPLAGRGGADLPGEGGDRRRLRGADPALSPGERLSPSSRSRNASTSLSSTERSTNALPIPRVRTNGTRPPLAFLSLRHMPHEPLRARRPPAASAARRLEMRRRPAPPPPPGTGRARPRSGRRGHSERHRLAVQQREAGLRLQRMAERMAEIEQRPPARRLALVLRDDRRLGADAGLDRVRAGPLRPRRAGRRRSPRTRRRSRDRRSARI